MAQADTVLDRAEAVRKKTLAVLNSLTETAQAFWLPDPAPRLARFAERLADNAYQVLVVGEAKRGKSTFVNALIGRDILPTDVDIATSEVFRICPRRTKHIAFALKTIRTRRSPLPTCLALAPRR